MYDRNYDINTAGRVNLNRSARCAINVSTKFLLPEVKLIILRPTDSRPVCLGDKGPSGTRDQFLSSFL
jgi:hypothetical protein